MLIEFDTHLLIEFETRVSIEFETHVVIEFDILACLSSLTTGVFIEFDNWCAYRVRRLI